MSSSPDSRNTTGTLALVRVNSARSFATRCEAAAPCNHRAFLEPQAEAHANATILTRGAGLTAAVSGLTRKVAEDRAVRGVG